MMYGNKLAIAIKHNGKVLREFDKDKVYLPFGAEYSIFIKNMDTVRASVSVSIDGTDVGDGDTFVVNGKSSVEIERFLKRGNHNSGNRFKFIERTGSIEQHRGVGVEDGLITVTYKFEKRAPKIVTEEIHHIHKHYYDDYWKPWHPYPRIYYGVNVDHTGGQAWSSSESFTVGSSGLQPNNSLARSVKLKNTGDSSAVGAVNTVLMSNAAVPSSGEGINLVQSAVAQQVNETGITVPGSISNQQFHDAAWFATEAEEYSLVLHLLGQVGEKQVIAPVTVKHKSKCVTCGHMNKASSKFCSQCATSLEIV